MKRKIKTVDAAKTAAEVVVKVEKRHMCDAAGCGYSTDRKGDLNRHKKTHLVVREKPYKCDEADCIFASAYKSVLKQHQLTHTGEKGFKCAFEGCSFTCTTNGGLKQHQLTHTGEKKFKCDEAGCGFTCLTKCHINRHKMTHTGEKPNKCNVAGCGFACSQKCGLTVHRLTHTGEKGFKCNVAGCGFACAQKGQLTIHTRRHTGEKPYPCDDCEMRFVASGKLRRHERHHARSALWTIICPHDSYAMTKGEGLACKKKFKHDRALNFHIQAAHTIDGLRKRLKSELRMADWFDSKGIKYDRDFANIVHHSRCPGLKKYFKGKYSRPDFHLYDLQLSNMIVLVGNDEFAHRRYSCEADRMMKITGAVGACKEFHNIPILYIRFNPHFYEVDGVMFDTPLETRYAELARVINRIAAGEFVLRNPTGLNVVYMYYPEQDGEVSCLTVDVPEENQEFVMVIKSCVCVKQ